MHLRRSYNLIGGDVLATIILIYIFRQMWDRMTNNGRHTFPNSIKKRLTHVPSRSTYNNHSFRGDRIFILQIFSLLFHLFLIMKMPNGKGFRIYLEWIFLIECFFYSLKQVIGPFLTESRGTNKNYIILIFCICHHSGSKRKTSENSYRKYSECQRRIQKDILIWHRDKDLNIKQQKPLN